METSSPRGDGVPENVIEVPVVALPQSSGSVMPGGDCGYCCLAGLLGLPSIKEAYEITESRMPDGWSNRASMCAWRWQFLLRSYGVLSNEFRPKHKYYKTGAVPVPWENLNWINGIRDLFKTGAIFVASIRFNGIPPPPPGTSGYTDHNVLLTGYRERWETVKHVKGALSQVRELRVSCSQKGEYWIDWEDLVYWHGCHPVFPIYLDTLRAAHRGDTRCPVSTSNDIDEV